MQLEDDNQCLIEGEAWLVDNHCQCLNFSCLFDGTNTTCNDLPGCNHCDFCEPLSPIMASISTILVNPPSPPPPSHHYIVQVDQDINDDMYGNEFEGMDFSGVEELGLTQKTAILSATHNLPINHSQQISSSNSNLLTMPPNSGTPATPSAISVPIPNSAQPSISVLCDASIYHQQ